MFFFFFQAEDGIRDIGVTGVQTCALQILPGRTSELLIAKSIAIKGRGGKSDGRAAKAVDFTSADLRCVPQSGMRSSQGGLIAAQTSPAGVVGGEARSRPVRR